MFQVYPIQKLVIYTAGANACPPLDVTLNCPCIRLRLPGQDSSHEGGIDRSGGAIKQVVATKGSRKAKVKGRKKKGERMKRVTGRDRLE